MTTTTNMRSEPGIDVARRMSKERYAADLRYQHSIGAHTHNPDCPLCKINAEKDRVACVQHAKLLERFGNDGDWENPDPRGE